MQSNWLRGRTISLMLNFFDKNLHEKNLRNYLIPSRDIDWLRPFKTITEEPDFSKTWGFRKIILKTVIHHFGGKKRHLL